LMRRLLRLEALLNADQEILGAFAGNPKLHGDEFEGFGLMLVFLPGHSFYLAQPILPDPGC
jgi:hypothetical protein